MDDAVAGGCNIAEAGPLAEARLLCLDNTPVGLAGTHWNEPVGDGKPVTDSRRGKLALLCLDSGNVIRAAGSSGAGAGDLGREGIGRGEIALSAVAFAEVAGSGDWTAETFTKGETGGSRTGNEDRVAVTVPTSDESFGDAVTS